MAVKKICSQLDKTTPTEREKHIDDIMHRLGKKFDCDDTVEVIENCTFDGVKFKKGQRGIIREMWADEFVGGIIGISGNFASSIQYAHEDFIKRIEIETKGG